MSTRIAALIARNQKTVANLPTMSAAEKFALLEQLDAERQTTKGVGESLTILDLHRLVEQDLWSWGMQTALEEGDGGKKRKSLALYMQQKMPLAEMLREIARDLSSISPADRFTLMTLLNERIHSDAKPKDRLNFADLYQLTRQSLWTWMTQRSLEARSKPKKQKSAKGAKSAKSPKTGAAKRHATAKSKKK